MIARTVAANKCIIILSEKSSGSSVLQNTLARLAGARHVRKTRHYQNETLYWTKAASMLGRPQIQMVDSEVPIARDRARADLIALLRDNLDGPPPEGDDDLLIMDGWRRLCEANAPVFIEKSPHHLCQWAAIELMLACDRLLSDIDFLFVGLVRNPMDTVYSQYKRWKSNPAEVERQWCVAYRNLQRLNDVIGARLVVVRYEDVVASVDTLAPILRFASAEEGAARVDDLHGRSLQKWKRDGLFGFTLRAETVALAEEFGYTRDTLDNASTTLWPVVRNVARARYLAYRRMKEFARGIAKKPR